MTFLNVLFLIVSVLLIIVSLLQSGKSDGISGAISGSSNLNVFVDNKDRGPEVVLSRITLILGILFFLLSIVIHLLLIK